MTKTAKDYAYENPTISYKGDKVSQSYIDYINKQRPASKQIAVNKKTNTAYVRDESKFTYGEIEVTTTERGTKTVTREYERAPSGGKGKQISEKVEVQGKVYQGAQPTKAEVTGTTPKTLTPSVQSTARTQMQVASSPLTPRVVSQQIINEMTPAEKRVQQKYDPNKYGAISIEKADTSLMGKAKFLLSNANLKVSSFIKKFKATDPATGEKDYLIGGTKWVEREYGLSVEREKEYRAKKESSTGLRKAVASYLLFSEKAGQFMLGAEKGTRERIREKPVSVAGEVALSAGLTTAFSAGKLAVVKTAGVLPVLQKAAPAAKIAGKVGQYGLLTVYGGSVAFNIATAEGGAYGKGQATGKELVRATSFAAGMKLGSNIIKPIEYQTRFELGLQKLPKTRQAAARQEFRNLKSLVRDIPRGAQEPSSIEWGKIERLRGNQKAITTVEGFFKGRKDVVIGGSVAQRTQVPKSGRIKLNAPSDIDLYTDNPYLIKELAGTLKSAGVKGVYLRGQKIYFGGTGKGFKAIEAHGLTTKGSKMFGMSEKNVFQETVGTVKSPFKPFSDVIKQTPEGIYVQNIKYQAARKLYGGFEVSVDTLGRARLDRYSKDIPNLMQLGESVGVAPRAAPSFSLNMNKVFFGKKALVSFGTFGADFSTGKMQVSTGNKGGYSSQFKAPEYSSYYSGIKVPAAFVPVPSYGSYKAQKPSGGFYPSVQMPKAPAGAYPTRQVKKTTYPTIPTTYKSYKMTVPTVPTYPTTPTTPSYPTIPSIPTGTTYPVIPKNPQPPSKDFDIGIPTGKAIKSKKRDTFGTDVSVYNPFDPKYFASIEASVLNVKGAIPKGKQLMTGLGIRPLKA